MRNPRPPRRPAHRADNRQHLEKRHLPLGHELRLRGALVVLRGEEIGVEDDGVDAHVAHAAPPKVEVGTTIRAEGEASATARPSYAR